MSFLKTVALAAAVAFSGSVASAAVLDFAQEAIDNGERGVEGQTLVLDGIAVRLESSHDAYLDDVSGGLPAGLGVCSTGLTWASQCIDSGDDNVGISGAGGSESVALWFDVAPVFDIMVTTLRAADHTLLTSNAHGAVGVEYLDGMGTYFNLGAIGIGDLLALNIGTVSAINFSYVGVEFYISAVSAQVPLPASALLMLGGLGAIGVIRMRRRAA